MGTGGAAKRAAARRRWMRAGAGVAIASALGAAAWVAGGARRWRDASIDGVVRRVGSDRGVPNVVVTVSGAPIGAGTSRRTTTDAGGRFAFEALPEGTYELVGTVRGVSVPAYGRATVEVPPGRAAVDTVLELESTARGDFVWPDGFERSGAP